MALPSESLRRHGKSFWFASFFLPKEIARQAAELYSFCRTIDDLADAPTEVSTQQNNCGTLAQTLNDLRSETSTRPEVLSFLELSNKAQLPKEAAECLVQTMISDSLKPAQIKDEADLLRYCYGAAGTVGLMMSHILGAKVPEARQPAIDLGIAMQMTNIARDVLEDSSQQRRYLPEDWVQQASAEDIQSSPQNSIPLRDAVAKAIERLLERADQHYESAAAGFHFIPAHSRKGIVISAHVYREIGIVLRKKNFRWWEGRVKVGLFKKILIALRVILK